MTDEFFQKMMDQAMEEMASGDQGWKSCDTNTLLLACFGHWSNRILKAITRPMWVFAGSLSGYIIWAIVKDIFDLT